MNMTGSVRNTVRSVIRYVAKYLNSSTQGKLSPNAVTLFGLFMHLPIALLIASGDFVSAAILLAFFGLFDALDGELARLQQKASNFGMLLDSVTDRVKEVLIYVSIAYYFVSIHQSALVIWVVGACGVGLIISYINAWSEAIVSKTNQKEQINKMFRSGLMSFDIRILTIIIGLLLGRLDIAIYTIVILGSVTILQRFFGASKRIG